MSYVLARTCVAIVGLVAACDAPVFGQLDASVAKDADLEAAPQAPSDSGDVASPATDAMSEAAVAALEADASPDAPPDASLPLTEDAGDGTVKPNGRCLDDAKVLGGECPGVVACTDRGLCDRTDNICCVDEQSAFCDARPACGGVLRQLRCDGDEDCVQGRVCCQSESATVCVAPADCSEANRACHRDADCAKNRCLNGIPVVFGLIELVGFDGIGFCRGK